MLVTLTIRQKRRFLPNLKKVKFTSELLKRSLRLTVSNAGGQIGG